jgi:predicted O-methyltransferase YrrM
MFPIRIQQVMDRVDALRHQVDDHWQVPREEAVVLAQLVRVGRCVSICEVGVSYGYSTLHLAAATAPMGGHVHAIDISPKKIAAATRHLTEAGLIDAVTLHQGDARAMLQVIKPAQPFDCVFIDAVKEQSMHYLEAVLPKLAERAMLMTDNTRTHAQELAGFVAHLRSLPHASSVAFDIGNGFEVTLIER